jgi:hypothetical protein
LDTLAWLREAIFYAEGSDIDRRSAPILELSSPISGLFRLSPEPAPKTLEALGK